MAVEPAPTSEQIEYAPYSSAWQGLSQPRPPPPASSSSRSFAPAEATAYPVCTAEPLWQRLLRPRDDADRRTGLVLTSCVAFALAAISAWALLTLAAVLLAEDGRSTTPGGVPRSQ